MEFKLHPRVSSSLVGQENLFSRFLEEIWGCHPIYTFREGLEDREGWKKEKGKLFSNLHCCHHSWMKVGYLALVFASSMLVHVCFCTLCCVGFGCLLACWDDLGGFHFVFF